MELGREEAQKLVEQYNKEGRDALPPPDKRFRGGRDHFGGGKSHSSSFPHPTPVILVFKLSYKMEAGCWPFWLKRVRYFSCHEIVVLIENKAHKNFFMANYSTQFETIFFADTMSKYCPTN